MCVSHVNQRAAGCTDTIALAQCAAALTNDESGRASLKQASAQHPVAECGWPPERHCGRRSAAAAAALQHQDSGVAASMGHKERRGCSASPLCADRVASDGCCGTGLVGAEAVDSRGGEDLGAEEQGAARKAVPQEVRPDACAGGGLQLSESCGVWASRRFLSCLRWAQSSCTERAARSPAYA